MDAITKLQDLILGHVKCNRGCTVKSLIKLPHTIDDLDFIASVLDSIAGLEKLGLIKSTTDQSEPYLIHFYAA